LGLAGNDSNIYKLVGPILVKQEKQEAMTQVKNRIEFINGEMYVKLMRESSKSCLSTKTNQMLVLEMMNNNSIHIDVHRKRVEMRSKELEKKQTEQRQKVDSFLFTFLIVLFFCFFCCCCCFGFVLFHRTENLFSRWLKFNVSLKCMLKLVFQRNRPHTHEQNKQGNFFLSSVSFI
jgi:hypothetical protein